MWSCRCGRGRYVVCVVVLGLRVCGRGRDVVCEVRRVCGRGREIVCSVVAGTPFVLLPGRRVCVCVWPWPGRCVCGRALVVA